MVPFEKENLDRNFVNNDEMSILEFLFRAIFDLIF